MKEYSTSVSVSTIKCDEEPAKLYNLDAEVDGYRDQKLTEEIKKTYNIKKDFSKLKEKLSEKDKKRKRDFFSFIYDLIRIIEELEYD